MNCLWCDREINETIHWGNIFFPNERKKICSICEKNLSLINGPTCRSCGRQTEMKLCHDCQWWTSYLKKDPLKKNVAIFAYNQFMKEIIARWKYRGDYVLVQLFRHHYQNYFQKHFKTIAKDALIVPIPLSKERLRERRFNQAEALTTLLREQKNVATNLLHRKHSEKQAKKTRSERLASKNPFIVQQRLKKPVILVDDIYTTGMTLRHAAMVLRANGCQDVYSFTLVRG